MQDQQRIIPGPPKTCGAKIPRQGNSRPLLKTFEDISKDLPLGFLGEWGAGVAPLMMAATPPYLLSEPQVPPNPDPGPIGHYPKHKKTF